MTIAALSASDPAAALSGAAATSPTDAPSEQRFLKLLVTQLNNQDPLNPMENAELTSQLAQMSTVSGIEKMNATLQSLVGQGASGQLLQASALVGHPVLAVGGNLVAGTDGAGFAVELPVSADSVKAVITDAGGNTVRTIDMGAQAAGLCPQSWDGKNDAGDALPPGKYQVKVIASNGTAAVPCTTLTYDQVDSASQANGTLSLDLRSGRSIPLTDVRRLG